MTKFNPGDDVLVDFDGLEHRGQVVRQSNGWVFAILAIDPNWDYGNQGARMVPQSTVCVPDGRVRHAE